MFIYINKNIFKISNIIYKINRKVKILRFLKNNDGSTDYYNTYLFNKKNLNYGNI